MFDSIKKLELIGTKMGLPQRSKPGKTCEAVHCVASVTVEVHEMEDHLMPLVTAAIHNNSHELTMPLRHCMKFSIVAPLRVGQL